MTEEKFTGTQRDTTRVEAFSDGVFAIAITFAILDVHTQVGPHLAGPWSLLRALAHTWTSYFPYFLSFLVIGIYWANHHYAFKLFKKTNHGLNLLNLLFLSTIAFVPFPTATLGRFVDVAADQTTAGALYAFGLLLPAVGWLALWSYAVAGSLIDDRVDDRFIRLLTLQYIGGVAVYIIALVFAFVDFKLGLLFSTVFALLALLPPSLLSRRYDNND